jgi:hypothetical protein
VENENLYSDPHREIIAKASQRPSCANLPNGQAKQSIILGRESSSSRGTFRSYFHTISCGTTAYIG